MSQVATSTSILFIKIKRISHAFIAKAAGSLGRLVGEVGASSIMIFMHPGYISLSMALRILKARLC
jgi:hypothetical protein